MLKVYILHVCMILKPWYLCDKYGTQNINTGKKLSLQEYSAVISVLLALKTLVGLHNILLVLPQFTYTSLLYSSHIRDVTSDLDIIFFHVYIYTE